MKSRDFCFWLQGYFEVAASDKNKGAESLSYQQTEVIRKHLALVFKHEIDPSMGNQEHQVELNDIHGSPGLGPNATTVIRC